MGCPFPGLDTGSGPGESSWTDDHYGKRFFVKSQGHWVTSAQSDPGSVWHTDLRLSSHAGQFGREEVPLGLHRNMFGMFFHFDRTFDDSSGHS